MKSAWIEYIDIYIYAWWEEDLNDTEVFRLSAATCSSHEYFVYFRSLDINVLYLITSSISHEESWCRESLIILVEIV